MSKVKLRECPFCGGEADCWSEDTNYSVMCRDCKAFGLYYRTEHEAIEAWNRRAVELQTPHHIKQYHCHHMSKVKYEDDGICPCCGREEGD